MVEHVVGEWKQFTFKMATIKDYPKILSHLRKVFYVHEPLNHISELSEAEYDAMDQFILARLKQDEGLSFYVEETKTGKVVGVRLTAKSTKKNIHAESDALALPQKLQRIFGFLDLISSKASIFDKYDIDYYADILVTSVNPEYGNEGLVHEIYERLLAMLKAKGYPACKTVFTNPVTRGVAEKLGFEELTRVYFRDYLDDKGEQMFPNAESGLFGSAMTHRLLQF